MADAGAPPTGKGDVVAVEVTAVAIELPSLATRIEWFDDWEQQTRSARKLAIRDREYYDCIQWTREEIDTLRERGQPVITKNRIAKKINFILGEEIKKRIDPAGRPRTPAHEDAARSATDALRYVKDAQKFDQARSAVLKDMLIEGYGGAIKQINEDGDPELTHVHWDRLGYDPKSRAPDFSDAKYVFIVNWFDLDDAIAEYPDAAEDIEEAVNGAPVVSYDDTTEDVPRLWLDGRRKRVKIVEMYSRVGGNWFRFDFTKGHDLRPPAPTGYLNEKRTKHVRPLLMASCYVDRNGMRYGVVRNLISSQDEVNKRTSKALHLLSVRQVIAERDAVLDPQKFQAELAKPDGYAETEPGALTDRRVQTKETGDLAQGQVILLQEAKQDIDTIGPSSSQLAQGPATATSGREFIARQQAGSQEIGPVFDSLREWDHAVFLLDWLCIRQTWTEEKWLRVTDDLELSGYRFTALNRRMTRAQRLQEILNKQPPPPMDKAMGIAAGVMAPMIMAQAQYQLQQLQQQAQQAAQQATQATQMGAAPPELAQQAQQQLAALGQPQTLVGIIMRNPLMSEEITANQVEQMLIDIVIDEAPETAVIQQEEFEKLAEITPTIVQGRPDMAPLMAKLLIRSSQLRDKREMLQELEKPPDPQQVQLQQQMQQLAQEQAKASVHVSQSHAILNQAKAAEATVTAKAKEAILPSEDLKNRGAAMHDAAIVGEKMSP